MLHALHVKKASGVTCCLAENLIRAKTLGCLVSHVPRPREPQQHVLCFVG